MMYAICTRANMHLQSPAISHETSQASLVKLEQIRGRPASRCREEEELRRKLLPKQMLVNTCVRPVLPGH